MDKYTLNQIIVICIHVFSLGFIIGLFIGRLVNE